MASTRDTLFRQWIMLQALPRYPQRMSTQQMGVYLAGEGFDVTPRTVQRDLDKLSTIFGYTAEEDGRSQLWFWPPGFGTLDVPGLDPSTALAFSLAERHLSDLLPPRTLELLDPYFRRAEEVLDEAQGTALGPWRDKVRVVGLGPSLQPANVDDTVQRTMYDALLHEQRVELVYEPRAEQTPKTYGFSPLALVSRQGVLYMVGPFWDYDNVVQIALHRVHSATPLADHVQRPEGFDIDHYVREQGGFNYPTGAGQIKLEVLFDPEAAKHLEERPLSDDQTLDTVGNRVRLCATVLDTDDLVWWLLGFGANVEVRKPKRLRRKVGEAVRATAKIYEE